VGGTKEKKSLKMIVIMVMRVKKGIQWDSSLMRVLEGPLYYFFLTPIELYFDLNIVVMNDPNF